MLSVPPHVNPFQMSLLDVFAFREVGVFDGHGPFGHEIANFVQESLPRDFLQSRCFQKRTGGTFH